MVVRCMMPSVPSLFSEPYQGAGVLRRSSGILLGLRSSPLRTLSNLHRRENFESKPSSPKRLDSSRGTSIRHITPTKQRPGFTPVSLRLSSSSDDAEGLRLAPWDASKRDLVAQNIITCFQIQIEQLLSPSLSSPTSPSFPNPQSSLSIFYLPNISLSSSMGDIQFVLEEIPRYSSRKRHCVAILMLVLHYHLQSNAFMAALKVVR